MVASLTHPSDLAKTSRSKKQHGKRSSKMMRQLDRKHFGMRTRRIVEELHRSNYETNAPRKANPTRLRRQAIIKT